MNIVIVGHVDHGKSTIIGRLLADTNSLPRGKLEQIKKNCERNSKPFEYAFLLDSLKDEQSQGITIDAARIFFRTKKRNYKIVDAPGHIEFIKNMVSGAAQAEAALLVIDASEGIQENSRRHGYLLSLLGIKQIAVLVNKMDLVKYDEKIYRKIVRDYTRFLKTISIKPLSFIPVSGMQGDNIAKRSSLLKWHKGAPVLKTLDQFQELGNPKNLPLRMPVQGVYKFTNFGDSRRIVAGTIESGSLQTGDTVSFFPSGKSAQIATIESFGNVKKTRGYRSGEAAGFTLKEQIYVSRGEVVASGSFVPHVASRILANVFWMGREPLQKSKDYFIKLGTSKTRARLLEVKRTLDSSSLKPLKGKKEIKRNQAAECLFSLRDPIAFDLHDRNPLLSRFVIVDDYEISGGGIIVKAAKDPQERIRKQILARNTKWVPSKISPEQRAEKYRQRATLILITGEAKTPRKEIAKELEFQLFHQGKIAFFTTFGNVLHGVNADIENEDESQEYVRRFAEVANLMLHAGMILICSAIKLTNEDLEMIRATVDHTRIETFWVGKESKKISDVILVPNTVKKATQKILEHLKVGFDEN